MNNVSLVSYNITLKKVGLNANLIQLDKIKGVVTDHTSETGLIVSQFPNMVVVAAPKKQVTVIIREEDIIINDSGTELNEERVTVLCAIAHGINGAIQETLAQLWLNYDFVFEFPSSRLAASFTGYFDAPALTNSKIVSNTENLTFASFTIGEKVNDNIVRTGINPLLDNNGDTTKQVGVQRSIISTTETLVPISELKTLLLTNYEACVQLQKDIQDTIKEE